MEPYQFLLTLTLVYWMSWRTDSFIRELNTPAQMTEKLKVNPGDSETRAIPAMASCYEISNYIPSASVLPYKSPLGNSSAAQTS